MKKKYIYITLAIVGIAGVVYGFKDKIFKEKTTSDDNSQENNNNTTPPPTVGVDEVVSNAPQKANDYKLAVGKKGRNVLNLQAILKNLDGKAITLDGQYGQQTKEAVAEHFRWGLTYTGNGSHLNKDDYYGLIQEAVKKGVWDNISKDFKANYKAYNKKLTLTE